MNSGRSHFIVMLIIACSALGVAALAQTQPAPASPPAAATPTPAAAKKPLGSQDVDFAKMTVETKPNGERRAVFDGPTVTLENLESHITTLKPGEIAHQPHWHGHEEIIAVKEGTIEVTISGKSQTVGPGSVFLYASNDLHGMRNVGTVPATYFVFAFYTDKSPKDAAAANLH